MKYHDRREISLAILHVHKHKDVDIDDVIAKFARLRVDVLPFACKPPIFNIVLSHFCCRLPKTLGMGKISI